MENLVGLLIESLVAVLLAATIAYCAILNRRLARLKLDEAAMRKTVTELLAATSAAERAIGALRATVGECEETLSDRLGRAKSLSQAMAGQLGAGEEVIERISRIARAAREHATEDAARQAAAQQDAHAAERARQDLARQDLARQDLARQDLARVDARRQAADLEARLRAQRAQSEAAPPAPAPLSRSAATAAAAELFASRMRALGAGAAA